MTTFRARVRAAGALTAALITGVTMISAAGTASASEEIPQESLIVQNLSDKLEIEPRIVGGQPADEDEYPFVAYLTIETPEGTFACGGSLYAADTILTAAHCVNGTGPADNITAHFGSVDLASDEIVTYQSEYVYSGNISGIPNDWALVKLTESVQGIDPVQVVSDDSLDGGTAIEDEENPAFTVIGWGDLADGAGEGSQFLQEVRVPAVADEDCIASYGEEFTPDAELCAGDLENGGVDSCQGDSGGPLLAVDGDDLIQVGVVSWGNGCAVEGFPGIYTQLSNFSDKIAAVSSGDNTPAEVADVQIETTAGTPVEITLTADDAEGDDVSFKVSEPEVGALTTDDETLANLVYTPAEGFTGEDTFLYLANDGSTDGIPAVVTVTVTEAPEPTPTPTPTPTDTPTEDPGDDDGDDNGEGGDGEELPDTGSSTTTMVSLALLLAAGGAGVAFAARRRTAGSNV